MNEAMPRELFGDVVDRSIRALQRRRLTLSRGWAFCMEQAHDLWHAERRLANELKRIPTCPAAAQFRIAGLAHERR
jgi:hypothetical protein